MRKILSFLLCISLLMAVVSLGVLDFNVSAATTWNIIPSDNYVYDTMTYNGVTTNALFPKSSAMYSGKYDSDSIYSCAALPVRFFKNYGISIRIPGSGSPSVLDGSGTFVQVSTPQKGDVLRKPGLHWAIVKAVNGNTITVFEQNYWWNDNGTWKAGKNRTISQADINNGTWVVYRCTSFNSSTSGNTHTHNYSISEYEAAHPHKYYKKCSCGDYYYTGETAKVSTCSECKGVTIQNIGVEKITSSNAYVKSVIYKPKSYAVERVGVKIRQEGKTYTEEWKFHKQDTKSAWKDYDNVTLEWDLNSECGYTLKHATKYYYKMYAVINGVEYWSDENSFTTTGSHSYGLWTTSVAATCTATGTQIRKCSCGKTETKTITALGHSFSQSFTVDKKATCAEAGSKSKHCTRCNAKSEITAIPVLTTHNLDDFVTTKQPTCTDAGAFKTTCTVCEKSWLGTEPALGHEFSSEWVIDKQATCNSQGSKSHHCTRCDAKSEITSIKSLSHQWDDWKIIKEPTTTNTGQKQRTCKREGCSEKETMIIAKLAQDGHTHKYNDWVIIKPATCTDNGTQEHTCTVCGEKENQSISKTEHTFGEWVVEIAATEDENGLEKRVCSECKAEETREIFELIESTDGQTKEDILEQNNSENIDLDNNASADSKVDKVDNNSDESSSNEETHLVLFISSAALLVILGTVLTIVLMKRKNK